MRISERPEAPTSAGRLSLILPLNRGRALNEEVVAEYRRILEQKAAFESIEVITVGACDDDPGDPGPDGHRTGGPTWDGYTHVAMDGGDWSAWRGRAWPPRPATISSCWMSSGITRRNPCFK